MKIGIAKIGQDVIFDRAKVFRSNVNGNFGTYKLISLLIEQNQNDIFFMLSGSDIAKTNYNNIVKYFTTKNLDAIILLPGIIKSAKDILLLNDISKSKAKLIILSDDPRCLRETLKFIDKKPYFVGMQNNDFIEWNGQNIEGNYVPLELSQCYKYERSCCVNKIFDFIVIANTSGNNYNRIAIIKELIKGIEANIYGRLSEEEKEMLISHNCVGEVGYNLMQAILGSSISTLLVPIEKDLVTSKYIEAIQRNVVPIFYKDYNTSLIGLNDYKFIISDNEQLKKALNEIKNDELMCKEIIVKLYSSFVEKNIDGKYLNDLIMKIVRE